MVVAVVMVVVMAVRVRVLATVARVAVLGHARLAGI
jgi:hypothetical protein